MDMFLPEGFRPGVGRDSQLQRDRCSQLHIDAAGEVVAVIRSWSTGFATSADGAPILSGVVDVFDGQERLFQALIAGSDVVAGERRYTVRRAGPVDYRTIAEIDAFAPEGPAPADSY